MEPAPNKKSLQSTPIVLANKLKRKVDTKQLKKPPLPKEINTKRRSVPNFDYESSKESAIAKKKSIVERVKLNMIGYNRLRRTKLDLVQP